jgi:hypothetical protein
MVTYQVYLVNLFIRQRLQHSFIYSRHSSVFNNTTSFFVPLAYRHNSDIFLRVLLLTFFLNSIRQCQEIHKRVHRDTRPFLYLIQTDSRLRMLSSVNLVGSAAPLLSYPVRVEYAREVEVN